MTRITVLVILVLAGCYETRSALLEGVFTMCEEVQGYSGETVVLKDGKFRYWFHSDVSAGDEPSYPLQGPYRVSGSTVTLDHPQIHSPRRTIATINGVQVLWREDGLKLWEGERRLHPYAVLLRVDVSSGESAE